MAGTQTQLTVFFQQGEANIDPLAEWMASCGVRLRPRWLPETKEGELTEIAIAVSPRFFSSEEIFR